MDNVGLDPSQFDYDLPAERIAQQPLPDRAASRMLILDRAQQTWRDAMFREFPEHLRSGDCLVLNDSKVLPSRLFGTRAGSPGEVEIFLINPLDAESKTWNALVRPGRKLGVGQRVQFRGAEAEIIARGEFGERTVRFILEGSIFDWLNREGHMPLPPYIKRQDSADDRERYQTVYGRTAGSVAAPTAGLHFTPEILDACRRHGADIATVTLHVGLGTFQPVRGDKLHLERFSVDELNARKIQEATRAVCVGTTSVRSVESLYLGRQGETDLFIHPGFSFQRTGALLTNFHLPQSSLLMLVCAFAGTELTLEAYRHAVATEYRFYSYGDCMLII